MNARALVRLSARCDNACRFCAQHGSVAADPIDVEAELVQARAHADELSFVGGEPTLVPGLPAAIARARALGFTAVGVQSHGRTLGHGDGLAQLLDAGLTDVHLSIHGAEAAVHDYHVGVEGAWAQVIAALRQLAAAKLPVVVSTVLTRSNARALAGLPSLLAGADVRAWRVSVPHAAGRAALEFDRVMPRLALAVPFALHAIERARRLGLAVAIEGAPACLLGPYLALAQCDAPRAFAAVCEGCGARARCAGLDAAYLRRFGGDELHARDDDAPAEAMAPALRRMFVGVGERVAVDGPAHESAAAARRRLPLLQRPAPGRDETRRKPEVAAALFPTLGDDDDDDDDD